LAILNESTEVPPRAMHRTGNQVTITDQDLIRRLATPHHVLGNIPMTREPHPISKLPGKLPQGSGRQRRSAAVLTLHRPAGTAAGHWGSQAMRDFWLTESALNYIWQPPPQHLGTPQLSPPPATGKLDLLLTAGAAGILKTRCKSAFPQLGQTFSSPIERTRTSTTMSQDLHSNS